MRVGNYTAFRFAIFLVYFAIQFATPAADTVKDDGEWKPLFNGKDLTGWTQVNDGTFVATNGLLHLEGGKGWLRTDKEFTNFIFEVEWRGLETNYNSGFFIRASVDGKPFPTNVWQVNLKQSAVGELLKGSQKIVTNTPPQLPVGEWVKFRLEARGRTLALSINGAQAWEFNELEPMRGCIGLQAEGKAFDFRNLRLQPLAE